MQRGHGASVNRLAALYAVCFICIGSAIFIGMYIAYHLGSAAALEAASHAGVKGHRDYLYSGFEASASRKEAGIEETLFQNKDAALLQHLTAGVDGRPSAEQLNAKALTAARDPEFDDFILVLAVDADRQGLIEATQSFRQVCSLYVSFPL